MPSTQSEHEEAVKIFFDREAASYRRTRYVCSDQQNFFLKRKELALHLLRGASGRLLDIGCGPYVFTPSLVELGFDVVSADLSFEMLNTSRSKSLKMVETSLSRLSFKDNSFDAVLCLGVLGYLHLPMQGIAEIARVLKPGGRAIVQISNRVCPARYLRKTIRGVYRRLVALTSVFRRERGPEGPLVFELYPFRLTTLTLGKFRDALGSSGLNPGREY